MSGPKSTAAAIRSSGSSATRSTVWADIFRDGHDKIAAVLKYAFEDEDWRETPFSFFDNDRWVGELPAGPGRALALHDRGLDRPFRKLARRSGQEAEAGQNIALELVEGERLVEAGDRARRRRPTQARLRAIAEEFGDGR